MSDAQRRKGYRVRRLKAARRERRQRWQLVTVGIAAVVVAAGAVVGAYYLVQSLVAEDAPQRELGRLALLTVGAKGESAPVAGLALWDPAHEAYRFLTVPRALLLEGPAGEYVMAGDEMGRPALARDLGRLIGAPVIDQVELSYRDLARLAGDGRLSLTLERAAKVKIGGVWRTYEGVVELAADELQQLLAAEGSDGEDEDTLAQAAFSAVFYSGALRPSQDRRATVATLTSSIADEERRVAARRVLSGLTDGAVEVDRLPSEGQVAEGQFAFRPDPSRIMAEVTRLTPGYGSRYTVIIQNGSGEAGIGDLVRQQLAVLDVNLPSPTNAASFDYEKTQLLAGSKALSLAEDVRAILGQGVVLSGEALPATTLVVVIGTDLEEEDLQ